MPPRSEPAPDPYKSQPIALLVGPASIEFYVHSDILNSKTTYWHRKLIDIPPGGDSDWYWVPVDTLYLDDDPTTVGLFLEFIYSRPSEYTVPESRPRIFIDMQLYCFGAKYQVAELEAHAIRKIREYLKSGESDRLPLSQRLYLIKRSYAQTTNKKDQLRKLLARDFAKRWEKYKSEALKDDEIDPSSEVGRVLSDFPAFERNLLVCLGDSKGDKLEGVV